MINFFSFGLGAATVVVLRLITDRLQGRRARCENCAHCKAISIFGTVDCAKECEAYIIRPRYCGKYKEKDNAQNSK